MSASPATPNDTQLLNWLSSLPVNTDYKSGWKFRKSSTGRGWRLMTTSEQPNYATPREALIAAFEECRQELNDLDQMLGDQEEPIDHNDWGGDLS